MTTAILSTKFFIPRPRPNLVSRTRLVRVLNVGLSGKLTLIPAPAGYGKTTLLSEWIGQLKIPVAWLSLDPEDNEPDHFLLYFTEALHKILPDCPAGSPSTRNTAKQPAPEAKLVPLINAISRCAGSFVLVLDDYHLIKDVSIHRIIGYLLAHLPPNLHLAISTRTDPPLPLSRLRARGELCEVRGADLQFDRHETTEFLNGKLDLELEENQIATLHEKTEGWIAGLQLAAISLKNHPDRAAFVAAFSGTHHFIADFLLDEALSGQPEHIQAFLIQTSLLDQFCATLCDAITGRADSSAIIESIEQANLFLVPLDNEHTWFRYHHLFSDLLRLRLKQAPDLQPETLYRRASAWYERADLLSEAVRLALLGGDTANTGRLMEGHALSILSNTQLSTLNRLLSALPNQAMQDDPWLVLARAWGLVFAGQAGLLDALLEKVEAALPDASPNERAKLQGRIWALRSYAASLQGERIESIRLSHVSLETLPEQDFSMRSFALLLQGNAKRFEGRLAEALSVHIEALNLSEQSGDTFLSVMILSRLTDVYRQLGRLNEGLDAAGNALERIRQHQRETGVSSFTLGYLNLRLSSLHYERNELPQAQACIEEGFELAQQWGGFDTISLGYFNTARIQQTQGDLGKALETLAEFKTTYPDESRQQYQLGCALEAEIHLRAKNLAAAEAWVRTSGLGIQKEIRFTDLQAYSTFAEYLCAQARWPEAFELLERLLALAQTSGEVLFETRILCIMALAYQVRGEMEQALTAIAQALACAAPAGLRRIFLDLREPMAQLLYQAGLEGISPAFCRVLLDDFPASFKISTDGQEDLVEPLSNRELEVLAGIAEGRTNQEIAGDLHLSLFTVKSHARNIFGKLGVKNRTEAAARARLLGILVEN